MGGVVLEHVDHVVERNEGIVDGHHRHALVDGGTEDEASNSAKSIDSDLGHGVGLRVGLTGFAIAKNKVWSRHGRGGLPIGLILSTLIFSCGFLQLFRANISIWHKAGMCPALRRRDWSMRFP